MIFTRKSNNGTFNTVEATSWVKKFALFPTCVSIDRAGLMQYVWLGWYETKTYYEKGHGWWKENRLPDSNNTWKEDANFCI